MSSSRPTPRLRCTDEVATVAAMSKLSVLPRGPGPDGQPYSLAQYLAEHHERTLPADAPPLTLSIEPPPVVERYATHAEFGRGRVLLRAEGKTRIELADSVRPLADSFLTFE